MQIEAIQIREADPQEIGAMALVVARANAQRDDAPLPIFPTEDQIADLQERMDRPHAWTYVATENGKIAGLALGYPRHEGASSSLVADTEYLSLLMVEPNAWGRGIASRLLGLVVENACNAGRSRLTLRTRKTDNDHARSVYEHKGFTLTGVTKASLYGIQVEYELDLQSAS